MRVLDVLGFSPKKIQSKFRTDKDGGMTFVLYTPHACLEECECKFALVMQTDWQDLLHMTPSWGQTGVRKRRIDLIRRFQDH